METILLSALCYLLTATGNLPAPADTTEKYIINGTAVEHFDGSALVGMTIKSWNTNLSKSGNNVIRQHYIITGPKTITKVYFLNNRSIDQTEFEILNTGSKDNISSVTVYFDPDDPSKQVYRILTKDFVEKEEQFKKEFEEKMTRPSKEKAYYHKPKPQVFVVDGKVVSQAEFNKTNYYDIERMDVIYEKDNPEIIKKYSAEGTSVVMVTLKKEKSKKYKATGDVGYWNNNKR